MAKIKTKIRNEFEALAQNISNNIKMENKTIKQKYQNIFEIRDFCSKVKKDKDLKKDVKTLVKEAGVEWDKNNIVLSINKALFNKVPESQKNTSHYKRALYDTPRIINILDDNKVKIKDTISYLEEHGIDKLANNRLKEDEDESKTEDKPINIVKIINKVRNLLDEIEKAQEGDTTYV